MPQEFDPQNRTIVKIKCDYCDAELLEKDFKDKQSLWSRGNQGSVEAYGGVSGFSKIEIKIACPKELCKARLLSWAHS